MKALPSCYYMVSEEISKCIYKITKLTVTKYYNVSRHYTHLAISTCIINFTNYAALYFADYFFSTLSGPYGQYINMHFQIILLVHQHAAAHNNHLQNI